MKSKAVEYTLLGVGVTASLGLIFHNQIGTLMIKTYKPTVTQKMVAKAKTAKANYDWKSVKSLTAQEMINARLHAGKLRYIGMVSVPEIGLSLPISKGVNDIALTFGAGTLYPDQVMGKNNYSLASHFVQGSSNKKVLFSPIYYEGKTGQHMYLTDMSKIYSYQATSVKVVQPTAVEVTYNQPNKNQLTLITCDYTAERGRVVIQGDLKQVYTWHDAPKEIRDSFSHTNEWHKS
ncbi:class A sortase [Weissella cibaria]|uniref:class A sortase n=1 Tax=Weissella cibaria TaxID=137591 RepID=UPI002A7623B6|nr:class A sortase [Weissella cibaria]MDY2519429.1 class A sortase [Weissella cibaria]